MSAENNIITLDKVYIIDKNGEKKEVSLKAEDKNSNLENGGDGSVLSVQIIGKENTVAGSANIMGGQSNNNDGDNNIVGGSKNTNTASNSFVGGDTNNNNGDNSIVGGSKNINTGANSFVNGFGLTNAQENAFVIGKYNKQGNYLFCIGNGSFESRKNIFTINTNNDFEINATIFVIKSKQLQLESDDEILLKSSSLKFEGDNVSFSGKKISFISENDENNVFLPEATTYIGKENITDNIPVKTGDFNNFKNSHNNIENGVANSSAVQKSYIIERDEDIGVTEDNVKDVNPQMSNSSKSSIVFGGFRADKNLYDEHGEPNFKELGSNPLQSDIDNIKDIVNNGRFAGSSFKNIISDTTTYADGFQAFIVGAGNRVYGNWSAAGGKDNVIIGKSGLVFGNGNVIASPGYDKEKYSFSFVVGSSNISAENGTHSLVMGENNTNLNSHSLVGGKGNLNKGKFSVVLGGGDVSGDVPFRNHNLADNGFIFGKGNIIKQNHNGSILLGESLTSTNENSTIVGKNSGNAVRGTPDLRFAVATGLTSETGTNGFEVYEGGETRVYKEPTHYAGVVRKKEIDESNARIKGIEDFLNGEGYSLRVENINLTKDMDDINIYQKTTADGANVLDDSYAIVNKIYGASEKKAYIVPNFPVVVGTKDGETTYTWYLDKGNHDKIQKGANAQYGVEIYETNKINGLVGIRGTVSEGQVSDFEDIGGSIGYSRGRPTLYITGQPQKTFANIGAPNLSNEYKPLVTLSSGDYKIDILYPGGKGKWDQIYKSVVPDGRWGSMSIDEIDDYSPYHYDPQIVINLIFLNKDLKQHWVTGSFSLYTKAIDSKTKYYIKQNDIETELISFNVYISTISVNVYLNNEEGYKNPLYYKDKRIKPVLIKYDTPLDENNSVAMFVDTTITQIENIKKNLIRYPYEYPYRINDSSSTLDEEDYTINWYDLFLKEDEESNGTLSVWGKNSTSDTSGCFIPASDWIPVKGGLQICLQNFIKDATENTVFKKVYIEGDDPDQTIKDSPVRIHIGFYDKNFVAFTGNSINCLVAKDANTYIIGEAPENAAFMRFYIVIKTGEGEVIKKEDSYIVRPMITIGNDYCKNFEIYQGDLIKFEKPITLGKYDCIENNRIVRQTDIIAFHLKKDGSPYSSVETNIKNSASESNLIWDPDNNLYLAYKKTEPEYVYYEPLDVNLRYRVWKNGVETIVGELPHNNGDKIAEVVYYTSVSYNSGTEEE